MPVERLSGNPKFLAQVADRGFRLPHAGHRQAQLGSRHLERPATLSSACPR